MTIRIKRCRLNDLTLLKEVGIETFYDTFKTDNTAGNMEDYLKKAFDPEQLTKELSNHDSEFYFIYEEETVAGYLKINKGPAQSEDMGKDMLEIERIYIRTAYQRSGFGKHLFNKAFERAKVHGKRRIWLGVWEKNEKALSFYKKLGFTKIGTHSFWMGQDEQIDFILSKEIH